MKRILFAILFILGTALSARSQSTTVSGTVTDTGAQTWNGGSYTFQLVANPNFPNLASYTWTGGTLNQTISGSLNGSGTYSQSVPSNSAISPQGSKWQLQVCPLATAACSLTANTTITGGTQTINVTPPAISINLNSTLGSLTRAYADAEITSSPLGGQYYNVTSSVIRLCTAVSGSACTTFVNAGGGGGGSVSTTGTPASPEITCFSGAASITNCNLSGDATTSNSSVVNVVKINGVAVNGTPSANQVPVASNATTSAWGAVPGGVSGLTTGFIPKAARATALSNSLCDEGITTVNMLTCTYSAGLAIQQALIGASPPAFTAGSGFAIGGTEGSGPTGTSGVDIEYMDSTFHALATNNNNTGNMVLSRTLCVNVTPVTVAANTTSDQNLQSCTISANSLNVVGHTIKVTTAGVFSTAVASTASLTFKVKLGTVSGCGSGTVSTPLNATTGATAALTASNLQFLESGYIVTQTNGAASSYEAQGTLVIDTSATATVSESIYPAANTTTVGTIDSTAGLFIQVTAAASAGSTSNSFVGRQLIVELVN